VLLHHAVALGELGLAHAPGEGAEGLAVAAAEDDEVLVAAALGFGREAQLTHPAQIGREPSRRQLTRLTVDPQRPLAEFVDPLVAGANADHAAVLNQHARCRELRKQIDARLGDDAPEAGEDQAADDRVVARYTFRGTQQGELMGIAPTGKAVNVPGVAIARLNGFDLTARVRADRKLSELPVILVTALETREDRERGIDVGANAYLVKSSFDQSNLLEAVRRLL